MSKKYKLKRFLTRRYQILGAILFILAAGLVLLPKYKKNEGVNPEVFVTKLISSERYISTDRLADRLVNQDPTVLLIDTRSDAEFNSFALPNAINIPLKDILNEDKRAYLDQDVYDVILYSNTNFYADQAWILANRLGYTNIYVLKGGLNEWFNTIISPKYPDETMPEEAFKLYSFRKAAAMFFGVGVTNKKAETSPSAPVKKVITVRKKKKKKPEGGC